MPNNIVQFFKRWLENVVFAHKVHYLIQQPTVSTSGSREVHWMDWSNLFLEILQACSKYNQLLSPRGFKAELDVVTVKLYANSKDQKNSIFKMDVDQLILREQKQNVNGIFTMNSIIFALLTRPKTLSALNLLFQDQRLALNKDKSKTDVHTYLN